MKVNITSLSSKKSGEIELLESIYALEPRKDLLHRMVRWQLAKAREGSHQTKGRSDISLTKAKMYRQKGSGGARHGAKSAPQFRGGGKAHGPVQRHHTHGLQKKVRRLALKHALSSKYHEDSLVIIENEKLQDAKTKQLSLAFDKLGIKQALVITGNSECNSNFKKAAGNLKSVNVLPAIGANVYDILRHKKLILTCDAVKALEERLS